MAGTQERKKKQKDDHVLFLRPHHEFATEGTPLLPPAPQKPGKSWKSAAMVAKPSPRETPGSSWLHAEDEAERNETHYAVPTSRDLILTQMCMSLGYCAYTLTAWVFCCFQRKELFPRCAEVWEGPMYGILAQGCGASTFLFWSFPIFCCLCVAVLFYRDLIHIRIWYEMLAHRVLIDFSNKNFLEHAKVRIMLGWLLLGATIYFLRGWKFISLDAVEMTLPYWFPVLSALGLLYTNWDLEARLLSLSKFVEEDPEWAKHYHNQCYFIRDSVAAAAFARVQEKLHSLGDPDAAGEAGQAEQGASSSSQDPKDRKMHPKRRPTTGGMIRMILDEATQMHEEGEEVAAYHPGYFAAFSSKYWANQFLSAEYLVDDRSRRFLLWLRVYMVYTFFLMAGLAYMLMATMVSHMLRQRLLPDSIVHNPFTKAISSRWIDDVEEQMNFFVFGAN